MVHRLVKFHAIVLVFGYIQLPCDMQVKITNTRNYIGSTNFSTDSVVVRHNKNKTASIHLFHHFIRIHNNIKYNI